MAPPYFWQSLERHVTQVRLFFKICDLLSLGVLELLAGWLVTKGKKIAILFIVAAILASLVYGLLVGRGFNFVMLVLGGVFLFWAITLWRRGGLS